MQFWIKNQPASSDLGAWIRLAHDSQLWHWRWAHSLWIKHSLYRHIYFFCNIMKRSFQEVIILSHVNASSSQKTKYRVQLLHTEMKHSFLFAKNITFLLWNHFILKTVFSYIRLCRLLLWSLTNYYLGGGDLMDLLILQFYQYSLWLSCQKDSLFNVIVIQKNVCLKMEYFC